MKIVIIILFIAVIASLMSALFFMIKDGGKRPRMLYSLALRVGLSVTILVLLIVAHNMGILQTKGLVAPVKSASTFNHIYLQN